MWQCRENWNAVKNRQITRNQTSMHWFVVQGVTSLLKRADQIENGLFPENSPVKMPQFRTEFMGYSVEWSPFDESLLAVATAQHFGIVGNGKQVVAFNILCVLVIWHQCAKYVSTSCGWIPEQGLSTLLLCLIHEMAFTIVRGAKRTTLSSLLVLEMARSRYVPSDFLYGRVVIPCFSCGI